MKRLISCALSCGIIVACLQVIAFAEEEKQETKTTVSGFGYFMFGQIVNGIVGNGIPNPAYPSGTYLPHYWQENADVDLYITSKQTDWLTVKAGLSVITSLPLQYGSMDMASFFTSYAFSVPMAEGIFHWTSPSTLSSFLVEAGFFQYTFNPDAKNLGNYMYRSTVVPLSIQTKIDYPWANMMGVRAEAGFLDNKIKVGAILNSIIDFMPWYDWSLGFTCSYSPNKVIEIGAAICFDRLINVGHNTYLADSTTNKMKALKEEARFTFDPKPLFGDPAFFGPEDCKIYGEAAVLGQNDSTLFNFLPKPIYWLGMPVRRMPLLLGINVPGFKILDVISVELEWFKSPYPNDWLGDLPKGVLAPRDFSGDDWEIDDYVNKDNFKWSVYLKKKIFSNFEVRAFAANDHYIYKAYNLGNTACSEQTLKRKGDWHWYCELRFNY
jgi:hypothetical protein